MALQFSYGVLYQQNAIHLPLTPSLDEDWCAAAIREFEAIVDDKAFPCVFARKANVERSNLFLFVDNKVAIDKMDDVVKGFIAYTQWIEVTPLPARLFQPLVVFFSYQKARSLRAQQKYAWEVLSYLHQHDPAPWPEHIPYDANDAGWSFCFNGMELFINISVPAHQKMRSRHLGNWITLVVNPRKNFDEVASLTSKSGVKIRQNIRQRVAVYNEGFTPTTLGFFNDPDNREWKQYQLQEPGALELISCPISRGKK